jgi:DNA-binding response OmpR family regulator
MVHLTPDPQRKRALISAPDLHISRINAQQAFRTLSHVTTVLVVEDEPAIADAVVTRLRSEGFTAQAEGDGLRAVEVCRQLKPDLVVLDLMLPGIDGLEVCRRIQADRRVPVVMLTARDDETDLIVGLSVGADDYVTKPFSPRELVARIRAVLRRVDDAAHGVVLRHDDLALDPSTRRVQRGGREVHLTPIEFDLLAHLLARPGTVFRREQLLAQVWGYADGTGPRTVDSHVRALRRKLGEDVVRTVHGVGYSLGSAT